MEAGLINQWAQQEIQKLSGKQDTAEDEQMEAEAETRSNIAGSLTFQHLLVGDSVPD